jgi:hypothetical protein
MSPALPARAGIVLGTRIHSTHHSRNADLSRLVEWCEAANRLCHIVLLAVDTENLEAVRARVGHLAPGVEIVHVTPWDGYCPPLNSLLARAARLGAGHLLLRSLEIDIGGADIEELYRFATPEALVVGARLEETHGGPPGDRPIDGLSSPWNTLALWNVATLSLSGFLAVSDGLYEPDSAGVEEVVVISLLQALHPERARALLIELPGVSWNARWPDTRRRTQHEAKMRSKVDRGELQLRSLNVPRGTVTIVARPRVLEPVPKDAER